MTGKFSPDCALAHSELCIIKEPPPSATIIAGSFTDVNIFYVCDKAAELIYDERISRIFLVNASGEKGFSIKAVPGIKTPPLEIASSV